AEEHDPGGPHLAEPVVEHPGPHGRGQDLREGQPGGVDRLDGDADQRGHQGRGPRRPQDPPRAGQRHRRGPDQGHEGETTGEANTRIDPRGICTVSLKCSTTRSGGVATAVLLTGSVDSSVAWADAGAAARSTAPTPRTAATSNRRRGVREVTRRDSRPVSPE